MAKKVEAKSEVGMALIEVPLAPLGEGYISSHVDMRVDVPQRQTLRRLFDGLDKAGERLNDGRRVQNNNDAIRWLLERIQASETAE